MAFEILNRPDKLPSDVLAFLVEFVHYFRHSAMWKFCYHVFFFGKQKQISNGKRGYDDALRVEYHLAPGMCEFSTPRRVTGFYDWHLAATSYRKAWRINIGHTIYINNGRMFMLFPGVLQHVCVCVRKCERFPFSPHIVNPKFDTKQRLGVKICGVRISTGSVIAEFYGPSTPPLLPLWWKTHTNWDTMLCRPQKLTNISRKVRHIMLLGSARSIYSKHGKPSSAIDGLANAIRQFLFYMHLHI